MSPRKPAAESTAAQVARDLRALRKGGGLTLRDPLADLSQATLATLGLDRRYSDVSDRRHAFIRLLLAAVHEIDETAPADAPYLHLALNLHREPTKWLDRAADFAGENHESVKTVTRRADRAFDLLAAAMLAKAAHKDPTARPEAKVALARLKELLDRRNEIQILTFDTSVTVHDDHVEVFETVEILAADDGAQFYLIGKTLPYATSRVETHVLRGARMLSVEQPNPHWLLELLELPEPLGRGTSHRFSVMHTARRMAPMWTATSMHEAHRLTVTVHYADNVPRPVWLIDGFPPKLLHADDIEPILEEHASTLPVNSVGTASFTFDQLKQDHSYGLGWTMLEEVELKT